MAKKAIFPGQRNKKCHRNRPYQLHRTDRNKGKDFFIERINPRVLAVYKKLQNMPNQACVVNLSVQRSSRVGPRAVTKILRYFNRTCQNTVLRGKVNSVIRCVEELTPDGRTKLFVGMSNKSLSTQFEFLCIAVRMYVENNRKLCDLCFSASSYSRTINKTGLVVCGGTIGAIGLGGFITGTVVTGGMLPIVLGVAGMVVGGAVAASAAETETEQAIRVRLEADFIYELVSRGEARVMDNNLYMTER